MVTSPRSLYSSPSCCQSFTITNQVILILIFAVIVFFTTYQQNCAVLSNLGPTRNGISSAKKNYFSNDNWNGGMSQRHHSPSQLSYDEMVDELADISVDRRVIILAGPHKTGMSPKKKMIRLLALASLTYIFLICNHRVNIYTK
jgi:hypothetical protein